ncbi:UNVERIFIED_CONTAM: hypothetical protein GTU68_033870 [Idotea baltica]|nr:hypothetical protein [Idotea baltica]
MDNSETIAAPISAPGAAAIACVRVSGPKTSAVIGKLIAKHFEVKVFDITATEEEPVVLDLALVSYFAGPRSFTGEDCAEFQLHGSAFLVSRLLECLFSLGVRQAEPGEFSKRAFLNGQIDLSQAEGVADLIAAETQAQARVAQQQLAGRLSNAISDLGEPLRDLLAEIEAFIDFPEEDIEPLDQQKWLSALKPVFDSVQKYVASYRSGKVYRDGAKVVLAGVPNAGKSSLLNAFVGESRAIVTDIAGTTRDSIESRIDVKGLAVNIWDTAGLVDSGVERDEVERLGIERSWKLLDDADLTMFVFSPDEDLAIQSKFFARVAKRSSKILVVLNKQDTIDLSRQKQLRIELKELIGEAPLLLSAETSSGVAELQEELYRRLVGDTNPQSSLLICNRRHFEALSQATEALERAQHLLRSGVIEPEFVSLEIRSSLSCIQEIVGVTHTEDILGRIFSKFCIGK